MIKQFNTWYDGLQEPWRFLLAMLLVMAGIWSLASGNVQVKLAAAVYLVILLLIRMKGSWDAST